MRLACVACRKTVVVTSAQDRVSRRPTSARSGTSPGKLGGTVRNKSGDGDSKQSAVIVNEEREYLKTSGQEAGLVHDEMARCVECDGFFHTPCLVKQQQQKQGDKAEEIGDWKTKTFKCAQCSSTTEREKSAGDINRLPLLVPAEALKYLEIENATHSSVSGKNRKKPTQAGKRLTDGASDSDGEEHADWFVFSKEVEVCTACRQVHIDVTDKAICSSCKVSVIHQRCHSPANSDYGAGIAQAEPSPSAQRAKKTPGRKRKRPHPGDANVSCHKCSNTTNVAGSTGDISSRNIAILARRSADATGPNEADDVKWWKSCHQCSRMFCLQEFCDQQPSDADLKMILGSTTSTGDLDSPWTCLHCAKSSVSEPETALIVEALIEKSVADQSSIQPELDASPSNDAAMATTLICGGCEKKFEMASVDPPVSAVPVGDWLCAACVVPASSTTTTTSATSIPEPARLGTLPVPQELVTLLICDGCEGEFDFAQLVPRLNEVPSGDWFCGSCSGNVQPTMVLPPVNVGEQLPLVDVTLLICDGCEGEFEMGALNPPLAHIPEGDWFCSVCESTRKSRAKAKSRRDKKGKRVSKPSNTALPPIPTAAPEGLVTLLICDGCEGEFDASLLNPPLAAIPEGDWFCSTCNVTRFGKTTASNGRSGAHTLQATTTAAIDQSAIAASCGGCGSNIDQQSIVPMAIGQIATAKALPLCNGCHSTSRVTAVLSSHSEEDNKLQEEDAVGNTDSQDDHSADLDSVPDVSRRAGGKKRKRGIGYQAKRRGKAMKKSEEPPSIIPVVNDEERAEPDFHASGMHIPLPVVPSSNGVHDEMNGAKPSGGSVNANAMLLLSDGDDSVSEDEAEDSVVIVCDMCLADFNLIEVVRNTAVKAAPPPRPWYCNSCVRSLKRTRKKRQRFSKQMLLEMQIYGELLRPTSAKAYDLKAAALRGKPPKTSSELKSMFALVGKRVGIYLKWDKHWVVGRVLAFEASHPSFHHVVRFEDGAEKSLPLYAFPMVIGTQTMLYVKVPTLQNQWWPGQLLRLNPMAKKLLAPDAEDSDTAMANFRLVSIYASNDCKGMTENVSCWVPKYLCRSMKKFSPHSADDAEIIDPASAQNGLAKFTASVERAKVERSRENEVLQAAFQKLVKLICVRNEHRRQQFAEALVGLELTDITQADSCGTDDSHCDTLKVARVDPETETLVLERDQVKVNVNLASPSNRYFLAKSADYAEIALQFYSSSVADTESPQEKETRAALDAAISSMPVNQAETQEVETLPADLPAEEKYCGLCLLPARVATEEPVNEAEEELVECVKCSQSFHLACCDPPHDPTPLLNEEDGSVILDDVKAPFVCSKCAVCAGCSKHFHAHQDFEGEANVELKPPSWSQWRLPLQIAALCAECVPFYDSNQFCAVCLRVLNDDAIATCIGLHSCSTCQLWVHAECEPDPHPAFLSCKDSADFELGVQVELPEVPASANGVDLCESKLSSGNDSADGVSDSLAKDALNAVSSLEYDLAAGESKPARLMDEEFAFRLAFKDTYDSKIMNKYECLTCRKSRMLQVIHRLKSEDKLELFKEPVTKIIAPTYFDVIKQPMDLSTMLKKTLQNGYTRVNFRDFRDDFELMCLNAVTFNSKERDFLIWREAWRFYGQGQRILRQTAPKSRMKHRGGKYHDALVIAAKRQLPNNSAIGKKRLQDGSDPVDDDFFGSANGDNEDDLDAMEDDRDNEDGKSGSNEQLDSADAQKMSDRKPDAVPAESVDGGLQVKKSEAITGSSALPNAGATPTATSAGALSFVAPTAKPERKPQAVETAIVLQSELGETPKPHSAIEVFKMVQARSSAHTYAWMDMCLTCGSAGLSSEMIFCVDCGEGFHSFCVPGMTSDRINGSEHLQAFWRCQNCKMCEICGRPGGDGDSTALHFCGHCDRGYHGSCMLPALGKPDYDQDLGDDAKDKSTRIYCANCVFCEECGKDQPEMTYSYDRSVCLSCSQSKQFEATIKQEKSKPLLQIWTAEARKQKKDSEKCPLCKLRWDPEDEELIQCDACELWAHPKCDSLLTDEPERYKNLVEDPSALYICGVCRPKERANLSSISDSWKCQVLIEMIQQKRDQTDAKWKEAREQLDQAKQWKYWKDQTPVYLYILRLGEECLKNLAYRSVNFRENWTRFTKEQELTANGVVIPSWLVQKASRYLRFKRYSRGPKASLRRQSRKSGNFYSQHGVEKQKDASVISAIVSEACSCAALLACVHLFYGWRPLPKVVLHLLGSEAATDQGHERLSDQTIKMLRQESAEMTLDEEIVMIKKQYERRVGKRHLVREQTDAGDNTFSDRGASHDVASNTTSPSSSSRAMMAANSSEKKTEIPTAPDGFVIAQDSPKVKQMVKMTKAAPLCGWPSADLSDSLNKTQDDSGSTSTQFAARSNARPKFADNRFCAFCFMIGDDLMCGRLIYTDKDQWVHVNCAMWSVEVYETVEGVLQKCQKAKNRSRLIRCDACGVLGASVGCAVSRCQRHFHFPCAYDYGVVFLPNGETCCPKPEHIAMVSRKQKLIAAAAPPATVIETAADVTALDSSDKQDVPDVGEHHIHVTTEVGDLSTEQLSAVQQNNVETAEAPETQKRSDERNVAQNEGATDGDQDEAMPEPSDQVSVSDAVTVSLESSAESERGLHQDASKQAPQSDGVMASDKLATTAAPEALDLASIEPTTVYGELPSAVPQPPVSTPVLPVVDPSPEPRRHLRSDPPIPTSDLKKQGSKSRRQKRPQCIRLGALTVQSFGHIVVGNPSFHSREVIFPLGFRSTRIFWSSRSLQTRCLYECVVTSTDIEDRLKEKGKKRPASDHEKPKTRARAVFKIVASDDRDRPIVAFTADDALIELRGRLVALYENQQYCFGSSYDKNPFVSRSSWFSYGLSGAHFFGFGVPDIVKEIEQLPHAATTSISRSLISKKLLASSPVGGSRKRHYEEMNTASPAINADAAANASEEVYVFTQHLPTSKQFEDALHEVEQLVVAEERARLSSGSTRTDGYEGHLAQDDDDGAPRAAPIRRRLNKQATRETPETQSSTNGTANSSSANSNNNNNSTVNANATANANAGGANTKGSSGVAMDLEHLPIAMQYRELRRRPFDERLEVRKSKIHGYGLFTKETMAEGQMIVEYQGQMIAQDVADEREKYYEEIGIGSCYMFRLDEKTIIDATRVGNLARFINHSCDPKAFARVVTVEGNEKKIVIFAKRAIEAGDEVTYDYKFPIEDEAIRCDCSAPNCIGRMN